MARPASARRCISAAEFFKRAAGIDILHVPYKGAAQATTDLVGGQVQMMFGPVVAVLPLAQAGQAPGAGRGLAETLRAGAGPADHGRKRRAGLRDHQLVWACGASRHAQGRDRAGSTPRPTARCNRPMWSRSSACRATSRCGGTPDEMNARIKTEIARWTKIIRDAGIQPQ